MRTHSLLAMSSALIMLVALGLVDGIAEAGGDPDPLRVVQGIAQAIGFIGAGLVFVSKGEVRNVVTAVDLWVAASVGMAVGAGMYGLAVLGTVFALLVITGKSLIRRKDDPE